MGLYDGEAAGFGSRPSTHWYILQSVSESGSKSAIVRVGNVAGKQRFRSGDSLD